VSVYADVVWPALILEAKLLSVLPIGVGLLVELVALRYGGFGLSWKRAAQVDISMNAVSALAGCFLIPIVGLGAAVLAPLAWQWPVTAITAVLVTTMIEAGVVSLGFKIEMDRKRMAILAAANAVSVGIALAGVWMSPPKH